MNKQWVVRETDIAKVREIVSVLGVSPIVAALLVNRNVGTSAEAKQFLDASLDRLHSPFLLNGMERSVLRIRKALELKEKILIYGDRDVDGVTAVAILYRTLKNLGADAVWTIPMDEGYGLHISVLERYRAEGVKLIVTVDCGTSSVEEIAYANAHGMDVIVTDHHQAPEILPDAFAIINPALKASRYPMKQLAGCFVALKLAQGLMFSYNRTFGTEYVVLDVETTGLSPESSEMVEVAAVRIKNFAVLEEFHSLIRPRVPIPPQLTAIHGITNEMVEDAPGLEDIFPKLMKFIGSSTVVAHNARFDVGFLSRASREILEEDFTNPVLDTLALAREHFKLPSHALGNLARDLKIDLLVAHRALSDCHATVEVFRRAEEIKDPRLRFFIEDHLDLVALGTLADVVPLTGENRIAVRQGLLRLTQTRKVGLKKLLHEVGLGDVQPTGRDVSWGVTPILNAAGRFFKADLAVKLLLTENSVEAAELVRQIMGLNEDRKDLQKTNMDHFFKLAEAQCDLENDALIFVVAEGLEHGVTGLVASRMARKFGRPAVLLIMKDGHAVGSCRSVPGFNIVEALEHAKDLLVKYGGHPAAAGLTVEPSRLEAVRERLKIFAKSVIGSRTETLDIDIDMEIPLSSVSTELIDQIACLEPFGEGNPAPVFAAKDVRCVEHSFIGQHKNHLRLRLSDALKSLSAVGWDMALVLPSPAPEGKVDVAFQIERDRWNGTEKPRLLLTDVRIAEKPFTLQEEVV
jgi:single-stranded-DNA-specific exonuclease